MDYNKINKIDIDGNGNITLQDVNGRDITVNYNDTVEIKKLIEKINDKQILEIKKLIASQDKFNKLLFDIASNIKTKQNDEKKKKKKNLLGEVIVIFMGIIGVIALIKEKLLGNVEIPYWGILFFIALIPIITSFIVAYKKKEDKTYKAIIVILFYSVILLFISTSFLLFTSAFFDIPKELCEYSFIKCNEKKNILEDTTAVDTSDVSKEEEISNSNNINIEDNKDNKQKKTKILQITINEWNKDYVKIIKINNQEITDWEFLNSNTIKFTYKSSFEIDKMLLININDKESDTIFIRKNDTITY